MNSTAGAALPPGHVFVVGLPRTGSTLTRGILNASGEVWIAGESHFFDQPQRLGLGRRRGYRTRLREAGRGAGDPATGIVDAIWSLTGKNFWARLASRTDRDQFLADLRASDGSDRSLFEIALTHSGRGRRIVGEKTPHHIEALPTLLAWFPDARVIHTFRDPRAIYASLRRKEDPQRLGRVGRFARHLGPLFDVYSTINLARSWRRMAALHRRYAADYPDRYRLIRFEDLTTDPESIARDVSAFLRIDYHPEMLEQVVHNSSYAAKGSGSGIDPGTVDRWRGQLRPLTVWWLGILCGRALREFGYR